MSNYSYYHRNFHGKSTFQHQNAFVPPPPTPPPFFITPMPEWQVENSDQEFLREFDKPSNKPLKQKVTSISEVRELICNLVLTLNKIKTQEKHLAANVNDFSDEEWTSKLQEVEKNKTVITKLLGDINNLNMEVLRKLLLKRSAKRLRQKRQRIERKKAKEEWIRQNQENSRKIDEHLQKIHDDINKAKQEEEAKLKADVVLRETIRKKQDAKKYIVKLDALVKLRKARYNTAKGRGENVSEKEGVLFETNIDKLNGLWAQRLAIYEKEEQELRAKLTQDALELSSNAKDKERQIRENIDKWKEVLFGGVLPQVDFANDVGRFVGIRSQWDQYLNTEGTSLPIGWVPPTNT